MNRQFNALVGLSAVALLAAGSLSFAAEEKDKPPMHMHKSEMTHKSDRDVAAEYKDEATQLREKAASHRELATNYRSRSAGKVNYAQIARHCDNLAKFYEDAAKEAEAVASGLKQ